MTVNTINNLISELEDKIKALNLKKGKMAAARGMKKCIWCNRYDYPYGDCHCGAR